MIDYKHKYEKYKTKYLLAKSQNIIGGGHGYGTTKIDGATENKLEVAGMSEIKNSTIKSKLNASGLLIFSNITVNGEANVSGKIRGSNGYFKKLNVSGSLTCSECKIDNLKVNGSIDISGSTVTKKAKISGSVKLSTCKFNTIEMSTLSAKISDSKIEKMIFTLDNSGESSSDKIVLKNCTIGTFIVLGTHINVYADEFTHIDSIKNATIIRTKT